MRVDWLQVLTGDNWEKPMFHAMRVDEVHYAITGFYFVSYYLIANLVVLNLFIAAILERLKITAEAKEDDVTEAHRAALIMKEAMEAEAAKKDLEEAQSFLSALKAAGGDPGEIQELEVVVAQLSAAAIKEEEEAAEAELAMKLCGINATHHTLGIFSKTNPIRKCAQVSYYWLTIGSLLVRSA